MIWRGTTWARLQKKPSLPHSKNTFWRALSVLNEPKKRLSTLMRAAEGLILDDFDLDFEEASVMSGEDFWRRRPGRRRGYCPRGLDRGLLTQLSLASTSGGKQSLINRVRPSDQPNNPSMMMMSSPRSGDASGPQTLPDLSGAAAWLKVGVDPSTLKC